MGAHQSTTSAQSWPTGGLVVTLKGDNAGTMIIPSNWREHCKADEAWCHGFLLEVVANDLQEQLHYPVPTLSDDAMQHINDTCKDDKETCKKLMHNALVNYWNRGLQEGTFDGSEGNAMWIGGGIIILLLVLCLAAAFVYYCVCRKPKGRVHGDGSSSKMGIGSSKRSSSKKKAGIGGGGNHTSHASRQSHSRSSFKKQKKHSGSKKK